MMGIRSLLSTLAAFAPPLQTGQHEEHELGMDRTLPAPHSPAADLAKEEADKRFSEFNHRFAGVFVFLVGVVALLQPYLARRFGVIRYLWTFLFFVPGVYLLVFSDPESWPIGNQTLYYVITQNMQVLQHKIFSLVLLALSAVEFLRVRGKLRALWTAFLFPAFAGAGAALLFFHSPQAHAAGMSSSAHQTMMQIQNQHVHFGLVGFGIAISKAIADTERFHPRWMRVIFAVFMMILGLLLITYTE
jgi:putative copper resistance protein D